MFLKDLNEELEAIIEETSIDNVFGFVQVVGQDSLTRFEKNEKNDTNKKYRRSNPFRCS
jgi:hypothetical protein